MKNRNDIHKSRLLAFKEQKLLEPKKFKSVLWVPWYEALEYLDKEDRSAVVAYCNRYRQEAN